MTEQNKQSVFNKRNFYTAKDSGWVYFCALLAPLLLGFLFSCLGTLIADLSGMKFAEGANIVEELFKSQLWFTIPYLIISQIAFMIVYFCYNKINHVSFNSTNLSFKKAKPLTCILSIVVGIVSVCGFILLVEVCFGEMFQSWGVKNPTFEIPLDNIGWYLGDLVLLGVIPAICEELIFRGMVMNGLREKFSGIWLILLNGLLFALMHQNLYQFVYTFVLGCVLGLVYERTNNLLYPMLLHLANNFTTITLSYLKEINVIKFEFTITWWFMLIVIALAGVTVLGFWLFDRFYLRKHNKIENEKTGELRQTPPMKIGKFPIILIVGMLVSLVFMVINATY